MNPSLNGFRAFAFFAVFLFHIGYVDGGYMGVHAFFVLSGFLLTPILLQTKNGRTLGQYYRNFLTRRALRIFPLYYFYLVLLFGITFLLGLTGEYVEGMKEQIPFLFTYTFNFSSFLKTTGSYPHIAHFWSLAVEEQFYLLWPLAIFCLPRRHIKSFLLGMMILGPIFRLYLGWIWSEGFFTNITDNRDTFVYLNTISYVDAFATGAFFGLCVKGEISTKKVVYFLLGALLIGYIANIIHLQKIDFFSLGYPPFMAFSARYVWGYTIANFCFALVLFKMKSRSFFPKIFEQPIIVYLGKISYGLYIYHFGIWKMVRLSLDVRNLIASPIALVLTILVSMASYHLFEAYFIGLKDTLAPKTKPHEKDHS